MSRQTCIYMYLSLTLPSQSSDVNDTTTNRTFTWYLFDQVAKSVMRILLSNESLKHFGVDRCNTSCSAHMTSLKSSLISHLHVQCENLLMSRSLHKRGIKPVRTCTCTCMSRDQMRSCLVQPYRYITLGYVSTLSMVE